MELLKAFLVGGLLCALGQILIDKPTLTPPGSWGLFVGAGGVVGAAGVIDKLVEFAGAGATIPLTGFGNTLAKGVKEAVAQDGLLGAFTGGFKAAAGGVTAAMVFGTLAALFFKPKDK